MTSVFPRGFSLIELLIALAIAGLLLVLALPAYTHWIADAEVLAGAESVASGMRTAQAEAIKRNADVQFVLGSSGWAAQTSSASPTDLQTGVFKEGSAHSIFTPFPAGLSTVTFTPLGQVAAANFDTSAPLARVQINSAMSGTRNLWVLVGGGRTGIKICDTNFTWPDPKGCPP